VLGAFFGDIRVKRGTRNLFKAMTGHDSWTEEGWEVREMIWPMAVYEYVLREKPKRRVPEELEYVEMME